MKYTINILAIAVFTTGLFAFTGQKAMTHKLTLKVSDLRNATGIVHFALYNREGSIPDKEFKNYYKAAKGKIINNTATVTIADLPKGKYAVSVLHDENNNGKIDKGLMLPKEGIGFSNYASINIKNKPAFSRASFHIGADTTVVIKINYF